MTFQAANIQDFLAGGVNDGQFSVVDSHHLRGFVAADLLFIAVAIGPALHLEVVEANGLTQLAAKGRTVDKLPVIPAHPVGAWRFLDCVARPCWPF